MICWVKHRWEYFQNPHYSTEVLMTRICSRCGVKQRMIRVAGQWKWY